jgi:uncharacterized protein (TIGR00251 family)
MMEPAVAIVQDDPRQPGSVLIAIKAVPGSSRDRIAGPLGERLKIRVSAAPEGGKANKAVAALLADALGIRAANVELVAGHSHPEKVFSVKGLTAPEVRGRLGLEG